MNKVVAFSDFHRVVGGVDLEQLMKIVPLLVTHGVYAGYKCQVVKNPYRQGTAFVISTPDSKRMILRMMWI